MQTTGGHCNMVRKIMKEIDAKRDKRLRVERKMVSVFIILQL
jgi:hypothetical protein